MSRCGGPFGSKVELLRGERQSGCLAFTLNSGEQPAHLQFSPRLAGHAARGVVAAPPHLN